MTVGDERKFSQIMKKNEKVKRRGGGKLFKFTEENLCLSH